MDTYEFIVRSKAIHGEWKNIIYRVSNLPLFILVAFITKVW